MMNGTRWAVLMTAVIAGGIAVLTLMPPPETDLPAGPDKLYHLIAFVALAFPLATIRPRWSPWLFLLFSLFGAAIELIQPYVGRSRELADLIADMLGIACGMAVGLLFGRLFPTLSRSTSPRVQH